MSVATEAQRTEYGPWNPGIESEVPPGLRPLLTIVRPENAFTNVAAAEEMRDLTGIDIRELIAFRPERLALHELLIRVTADFSVPDGSRIEDLGINFRQIVGVVLGRYLEPNMSAVRAAYEATRKQCATLIESELDALFPGSSSASAQSAKEARPGFLARFSRRRASATAAAEGPNHEARLIASWEAKAHTGDSASQASYRALARVVSALLVRHERVWGSREMIANLATDIACNSAGGEVIGRLIEPYLVDAAQREGYALLPKQEHPMVMNTKGASASGKSTLRPLQKKLAGDIGVRWSEFALISPDIWRKQLLDYATLGADYKYGGAFTGDEVQIIDEKLDRYMASKAERGDMSHLLIDRFRFDSFAPDSSEAGSNLLTRFGHTVYLFFMITPPASLVERAWNRGLEFGRYKAVDDTLAHSVEAYSGIPELFFTWVRRADKQVRFEFLDNSVALGEQPRTVAFGSNDTLNVLDVSRVLDIERFRHVNVDAHSPELLFDNKELLAPMHNTGFLRLCIARIREVNFADQATGRVYLQIVAGAPVWVDPEALAMAAASEDTRAGLLAAAPAVLRGGFSTPAAPRYLRDLPSTGPIHTLGQWGRETT